LRVSEVGQVVPGFYVLGNAHIPSYLLDGESPTLFDAGVSFYAERYAADARRILQGRPPRFLFLTHAHFDHCGAAGALQRAFPQLRIGASARAAEILRRPTAVDLIRSLNEEARSLAPECAGEASPFVPFEVDLVLSDGDEIEAGEGLSIRVLATPGHTRDFLSYYVPERRILVASEAVGCADRFGRIQTEFIADYHAYVAALRRLRELEVDVLCQGHVHVWLGEEARGFFDRSLRAAEEYREWVEELLEEEGGDLPRVVAQVKAAEWDAAPEPKQPLGAYLLNTEARVRRLASQRGAAEATGQSKDSSC
jgi:2-aminobenzoylacetyl-CoA thioesterase